MTTPKTPPSPPGQQTSTKPKCISPGCPRDQIAKQFCWGHYRRLLDGKDPMTPLRPKAKKTHEVVERFRVPIAHREALDMEAAKRDLTMYQLMASIVAEWYDAHAPEKTRAPVSVSKPSKVASAPTMPVPAPAPAVTRAPDAKSVVDLRRRQVDLARKQVELLAKIPNRTPEEETQLVMALEHWEFVAGKLNEEYERSLRGGYTTTEQVIT